MKNKKVSINNLKFNKLRKQIGEIEVYNPNQHQKDKLVEIVTESAKLINNNKDLEVQTNFNSIGMLRYMFNELTNIGEIDTLNDKELEDLIINPNEDLSQVVIEFREILTQINGIIKYNAQQQLQTLDAFSDGVLNVMKMNEIAKKLGVPLDTLMQIGTSQKKKGKK